MAKSYRHATLICIILSFLAALGIVWGLFQHEPLLIALFLLPTIIYEVYRTEGKSTKLASWGLLGIFILEILLILGKVNFDLAGFLGTKQKQLAGHAVPLGDIKVVTPTAMAILSLVLFTNTRGRYTKWLAVIIFITSFAIVYVLDPNLFARLLKIGVNEGLRQIQ